MKGTTESRHHADLGERWLCWKATCPCSLRKTKPTTSGSSARRMPGPYVKDGINDYVVHGQQGRGKPRMHGTKVAAHHTCRWRREGPRCCAFGLSDVAPGNSKDPFAGFDEMFARALAAKRTNSIARSRRPQRAKTKLVSCARPWPACCGRSSISCSMSTSGSRNTAAIPFQPERPARAIASGAIWSTTTSSPCRTSGSIPGTRPGTWPFTRSRLRRRHRLRQGAARPDAFSRGTFIRTGRSPPMNGTSATSTRPCMPGPRSASTGRSRPREARAI